MWYTSPDGKKRWVRKEYAEMMTVYDKFDALCKEKGWDAKCPTYKEIMSYITEEEKIMILKYAKIISDIRSCMDEAERK